MYFAFFMCLGIHSGLKLVLFNCGPLLCYVKVWTTVYVFYKIKELSMLARCLNYYFLLNSSRTRILLLYDENLSCNILDCNISSYRPPPPNRSFCLCLIFNQTIFLFSLSPSLYCDFYSYPCSISRKKFLYSILVTCAVFSLALWSHDFESDSRFRSDRYIVFYCW